MPAQAMPRMWPPNSFRHYPLSLKVLQEHCFSGQSWVPYKEAVSAPYLTYEEMKMLFAVDSPRVTQPSCSTSALARSSGKRPSLYPGQSNLLALPQLSHPGKTGGDHLAAAGKTAPQE